MERKSNYFKIGLFALSAALLILIALFGLGAKSIFQKQWLIETYFNDSVQGLEVGSPVKYLGVQIGTVKDIGFVQESYKTHKNYVRVVIAANPCLLGATKQEVHTITKKDLREYCKQEVGRGYRIAMAMQGVTGNSYLETRYFSKGINSSKPLAVNWTPKHPYIPSAKGTIQKIGSSVERVLGKLEQVPFKTIGDQAEQTLQTINSLMTNDLRSSLANIDRATAKFPAEAKHLRTEVNRMLTEDLHPILTNLQASTEMLPATIRQMQSALGQAERWSAENRLDLTEIVENVRATTENLRELSDAARTYPARIIFGKPPSHPKVMEQYEK